MHSMTTRRLALIAFTVALTVPVSHARAAIITVNSIEDTVTNGCETNIGGCTLREAILAASSATGRDTIRFDPEIFPPGALTSIVIATPLPQIADPAGTAVDGTGAGVMIQSGIAQDQDDSEGGLVFASAPDVPLANVAVINVTVSGFARNGVFVCGGLPPNCIADVTTPLVQHVVATSQGSSGIAIRGDKITKARIVDSVSRNNQDGITVLASIAVGTRVERCAAFENEFVGIGFLAGELVDTVVTDITAARNEAGVGLVAFDRVAKTKVTNVAVSENRGPGLLLETLHEVTAASLTNVVASRNEELGVGVYGDLVTGVTLKDVVANGNAAGITLEADIAGGAAKITQATTVGNTGHGIALVGPWQGAKITRASSAGNGMHGLLVTGSANVVKQVRASENGEAGIRVQAPGGGNRIEKSSGIVNQGPGISVAVGSTANTIQKNVALGSDNTDLVDENPDCATNVWTKNTFEMRNYACIR